MLVVGIDPALDSLPEELLDGVHTLEAAADSVGRYCCALIDGVADVVAVVKPQAAFFEQFGPAGVEQLRLVTARAREAGLLVLLDAKRGDIGSTMAAYAAATIGRVELEQKEIGVIDADAVTANPYLGRDALAPLLDAATRYDKGVFLLVQTSNPGAKDLQLLAAGGAGEGTVAEHVARFVAQLGANAVTKAGYSNIGAVCGLTHPDQAKRLRAIMPNTMILVPGLGAQGGRAEDVPAFLNADGLGALVNASRSIGRAWQSSDRAGDPLTRVRIAAGEAARAHSAEIRHAAGKAGRGRW